MAPSRLFDMPQSTDYGMLGSAVSTAGWLLSAGGVVILTFKPRARWEPSEHDVSAAPQRIAGLLAAAGIGVVWKRVSDSAYDDLLTRLSLGLLLGCLLSLIVYAVLVRAKTYVQEFLSPVNEIEFRSIIGGFRLTDAARRSLKKLPGLTQEELLRDSGNDPDNVWKPFYRRLAKVCFISGYIGLTVCGSMALSLTAIVLLPKERIRVVEELSGSQFSGVGDNWSPWYSVELGAAPSGYTLSRTEFWLAGERKCNDGAECREARKNDSGVTELFRIRGRAGSASALRSEGHLKVTYEALPGTPSVRPSSDLPDQLAGPEAVPADAQH
jgi:hypothetical protein